MPVARAALHLQPSEISEASMTGDEDVALFVYMVNRKSGDSLAAEMLRAKARANIERSHAMGLTAAWMEWNLSRKGLVITPRFISRLADHPEAARSED